MRAVVTPGSAHVARWSGAVAVVGPAGHDADAIITALDGTPARNEATVRALLTGAPSTVSAAVVLTDTEPGDARTALVTGQGRVTHSGATVATASGDLAWGLVTGTVVVVALDATATAAADGVRDLRAGIVAGSALTLSYEPASGPSVDADRSGASRPEDTGRFSFVDLRVTGEDLARDPLPIATPPGPQKGLVTVSTQPDGNDAVSETVLGIFCARHHFNHPQARYCNRCGLSMLQLTHNLVAGPRPTLGFLVFDDGATWALDRPYLLGRDGESARGDGAERLYVGGDAATVSVDHAEIRLESWNVTLMDLGSTNGTYLWDAAAGRWDPLIPRRPVTLEPGAVAALGHRTFVYESALLR
jgi:hypothetical protein